MPDKTWTGSPQGRGGRKSSPASVHEDGDRELFSLVDGMGSSLPTGNSPLPSLATQEDFVVKYAMWEQGFTLTGPTSRSVHGCIMRKFIIIYVVASRIISKWVMNQIHNYKISKGNKLQSGVCYVLSSQRGIW